MLLPVCTLIFGFTSSPFILGSILKFHATCYPVDACHTIMENQFYVDNLLITESDLVKLTWIYSLARECLQYKFVIQTTSEVK